MARTIMFATLVTGTLDILFAIVLTLLNGRDPAAMLRFVASGPYPPATQMGAAGAILGLAVHFGLMAIMMAAFVFAARQYPQLLGQPIRSGILYGLATYVVMNLIVVPLRFGAPLPPPLISIVTQLFAHIVLVGIPVAVIAAGQCRGRLIA